jgi:hypothetical protein
MWRPLGPWPAIAAVGLIAVLARLPFLGVGLVPDEGGYAHVASAWSEGARLYHDAWVDRPQGLMLAYRILLQLHDGPLAIRLGAMAAGAAVTLLLVAVGWIAHSPAAGISAACVYALVAVAPRRAWRATPSTRSSRPASRRQRRSSWRCLRDGAESRGSSCLPASSAQAAC